MRHSCTICALVMRVRHRFDQTHGHAGAPTGSPSGGQRNARRTCPAGASWRVRRGPHRGRRPVPGPPGPRLVAGGLLPARQPRRTGHGRPAPVRACLVGRPASARACAVRPAPDPALRPRGARLVPVVPPSAGAGVHRRRRRPAHPRMAAPHHVPAGVLWPTCRPASGAAAWSAAPATKGGRRLGRSRRRDPHGRPCAGCTWTARHTWTRAAWRGAARTSRSGRGHG